MADLQKTFSKFMGETFAGFPTTTKKHHVNYTDESPSQPVGREDQFLVVQHRLNAPSVLYFDTYTHAKFTPGGLATYAALKVIGSVFQGAMAFGQITVEKQDIMSREGHDIPVPLPRSRYMVTSRDYGLAEPSPFNLRFEGFKKEMAGWQKVVTDMKEYGRILSDREGKSRHYSNEAADTIKQLEEKYKGQTYDQVNDRISIEYKLSEADDKPYSHTKEEALHYDRYIHLCNDARAWKNAQEALEQRHTDEEFLKKFNRNYGSLQGAALAGDKAWEQGVKRIEEKLDPAPVQAYDPYASIRKRQPELVPTSP